LARVERLVRSGKNLAEEPQRSLPLEEVDGRDEAREVAPGVDVDASLATKPLHHGAVHDAEVEPDLSRICSFHWTCKDAGVTTRIFLARWRIMSSGRHPGFDCLAEAHVVRDEQVDPGHLDRPDDGVKLVVLDVDAAAERRLDVPHIGGGSGTPTDGVEERIGLVGRIETGGIGQRDFSTIRAPGSSSQMDVEFLAQGVVLNGREREQILGGSIPACNAREAVGSARPRSRPTYGIER